MQTGVVGIVARLMTEKVTVRPGLAETAVGLPAPFADGKGDGLCREFGADGLHGGFHPVVVLPLVLAALQHERAEPRPRTFAATVQHFFRREAVTRGMAVGTAQPAIIAVVAATGRDFYQPPDVDPAAKPRPRHLESTVSYAFRLPSVEGGEQHAPALPSRAFAP